MRRDDGVLLQDMLTCCREIQEDLRGMSLDQFAGDRKLCRVIERCLEVLGEAAGRVSPQLRDAHPEIEWQDIKDLRNVLAHDYGNIEYEALYKAATIDVPVLAAALEAIVYGGRGVKEMSRLYVASLT